MSKWIDWNEPGLPLSFAAHFGVALLSLVAFGQPKPFEVSEEAIAVEVISESQVSMTRGVKTAEKPLPNVPEKADKVADLRKENDPGEAKKDVTAAPPPKPQEATTKAEPKPEPLKPEPPKPVEPPRIASLPVPTPAPKPAAKAAPKSPDEEEEEDTPDAEVIREQKRKAQQKAEEARKAEEKRKADQAKAEEEAQKRADAKKLADKIAAEEAKAEALEKKREEAEKLEKAKKLAEAKAQADAKKADEERKKREAALAQPAFNPDAIRNRLNTSKETPSSTGSTAQQVSRQASLGAPTATGQKLSPSERGQLEGILQEQIQRCWSVNVTSAPSVKPVVKIELSADGAIVGGPTLTNSSGDPNFRAVAESGMRAIRQCAPYRIPAKFNAFYNDWKTINVRLDPSDLL